MKILLLSQFFEPEPFNKGVSFGNELQRYGYEVTALTGFPNYPGGRVYPGYQMRWRQREVMQGIPVTRVALYPSHDRSAVRRIVNYLSFALSSLIAIFCLPRPDLVFLYTPPPTAALAAMALRLIRGVPFVVNDNDLWPDTLHATGMIRSKTVLKLIQLWVDTIYRRAANIIVLSEGYRQRLIDRGIAAEKISVIPNWSIEDVTHGVVRKPRIAGESFEILFAGNIGPAQNLDIVLDAAHILLTQAPDICLVIAGGGLEQPRLAERAEAEGLTNLRFLGRIPPPEMPDVFNQADAVLVHLRDEPLFECTVPSKIPAYLRAGKPILMGVRGDAAVMIRDANAGIAFEPDNGVALAEAAIRMRDLSTEQFSAMGEAGEAYYRDRLSCEVGTLAFIRIFEQVVAKQRGRAS